MTFREQLAIALTLVLAFMTIATAYPTDHNLAASTRAMLRGGFEGRTELALMQTQQFVATSQLLRKSNS